jgi:acetoin utilization protein AcuC
LDKIGIVYNEEIKKYDFGPGHPFRGTRFREYMQLIRRKRILDDPSVFLLSSEPACNEDLELAHSRKYIEKVIKNAKRGLSLSPDTPLTTSIVEAARYIVGGGIKAASLLFEGYWLVDVVGGGLHHAGRDYGGGFCVFNDIAICTMRLLRRPDINKVLILDTDVHAGNGTMDIFSSEPRVLFIDIHQDPSTIYPGKGFLDEIGENLGKGYTINVPIPPGAGDQEFECILNRVFMPLVEQFEPQVIIRNGGSDPHFADFLGSLQVTYNGFYSIGKSVRLAAESVGAPIINMSCSGYNPYTIAEGMYAILTGILGINLDVEEIFSQKYRRSHMGAVEKTIEELAISLQDYWSF